MHFFPHLNLPGGGFLTPVPVFCLISTMSFKLNGTWALVENDGAFGMRAVDAQGNRVEISG